SMLGFSWAEIRSNIENRLLRTLVRGMRITQHERDFLLDQRRLLDIFYRIIDNDESLKSRQNGVRFNGLLVTSIADGSVVGFLAYIFHTLLMFFTDSYSHLLWSYLFVAVWLLSTYVLLPLALNRHLELSNEQLDYIDTHRSTEVRAFSREAMQQLHG